MSASNPTEQLVEDVASVYFGAIGVAIKRGVEIDDAGERLSAGQAGGDSSQCVLSERLGASLQRRNPGLLHDTFEGVTRTLSHLASDPGAEHRTS